METLERNLPVLDQGERMRRSQELRNHRTFLFRKVPANGRIVAEEEWHRAIVGGGRKKCASKLLAQLIYLSHVVRRGKTWPKCVAPWIRVTEKALEAMIGYSAKSIRGALRHLEGLGLILREDWKDQFGVSHRRVKGGYPDRNRRICLDVPVIDKWLEESQLSEAEEIIADVIQNRSKLPVNTIPDRRFLKSPSGSLTGLIRVRSDYTIKPPKSPSEEGDYWRLSGRRSSGVPRMLFQLAGDESMPTAPSWKQRTGARDKVWVLSDPAPPENYAFSAISKCPLFLALLRAFGVEQITQPEARGCGDLFRKLNESKLEYLLFELVNCRVRGLAGLLRLMEKANDPEIVRHCLTVPESNRRRREFCLRAKNWGTLRNVCGNQVHPGEYGMFGVQWSLMTLMSDSPDHAVSRSILSASLSEGGLLIPHPDTDALTVSLCLWTR